MLSNNYHPKGRDDLLKRDLEDGGVLYDQETSQIYTLNTTAALIWEYCDKNNSIKEIAGELAETCNLTMEDILEDVRKIISGFHSKGLLEADSKTP